MLPLFILTGSKPIDKRLQKVPKAPNIITLNEAGTFGIDETVVGNIHWLEYRYHLEKDSSWEVYSSSRSSGSVWDKIDTTGSLSERYLRYPAYRYYPVVGISHEQAKAYGVWRSKMVSLRINQLTFKELDPFKWDTDTIWDINYRLPTEKEWEQAAAGGLDLGKYPLGTSEIYGLYKGKDWKTAFKYADSTWTKESFKKSFKSLNNKNIKPNINCLDCYPEGYPDFLTKNLTKVDPFWGISVPSPIDDFYAHPPNGFGFYNMVGNVAEMVEEKGIAKGGSFAHTQKECDIKNQILYDGPQAWLGVRYACDIRKIKNPYR